MRKILLFIAAASALLAQSSNYPGALDTNSTLFVTADNVQTVLTNAMAIGDSVAVVQSTTGFAANMIATICDATTKVSGNVTKCSAWENMLVTSVVNSNTLAVTRGIAGTSPRAHANGAIISILIDSVHQQSLKSAVIAIETALGPNLQNIPKALPFVASSSYTFTPQSPGGSLIVGNNTITMTPVPPGVNGTDTGHYLYVSGGTGTAEACLITGGSGVGGQPSGQIIIQCANTHSGAWTIQSATIGISEALSAAGTNPVTVLVPAGSFTIYGPISLPVNSAVSGQSLYGTTLNVATSFPASVNGVFIGPTPVSGNGPVVKDLTVAFTQPDSTNIALYTHWPPAFYMVNCARFMLQNILVIAAWDVVNMTGNSGGAIINNLQASHFHTGINIDGALDSVYLDNVRFWPYGLTPNQMTLFINKSNGTVGLLCARMDDFHANNFFSENPTGAHFYQSVNGVTGGQMTNVVLDSWSSMIIDAGNLNISQLTIAMTTFDSIGLTVNGGVVQVAASSFFPGDNLGTSQPWIKLTGGLLQISNSWFWTADLNISTILQTAGESIITGNYFNRAGSVAYTAPTISVTGGSGTRTIIVGNRATDKGSGAGTFVSIVTDDWNQVRGNVGVGWAYSFPATTADGIYESDATAFMHGVTSTSENWITNETGANNAIAGTLPGAAFASGQQVYVVLAHTLQAGANTFALNGNTPLAIKSSKTLLNITTPYSVGGVIHLLIQGGLALDMSQ